VTEKPSLVKCLVLGPGFNTCGEGDAAEDQDVRLSVNPGRDRRVDSRGGSAVDRPVKNDYDLAWWRRLEELSVDEYFVQPQIGGGRKSDSVVAAIAAE